MKNFLLLLLAVALCASCASRYNITLTNGEVITARGKPKLDKEHTGYYFTDANGNANYISLGNVHEVAPQSWKKKYDDKSFKYLPAPGSQ
jgi:Bacterial protein of unknown function (DUF903)